jgi:lipopolysaccharide/colanic/teichoic acid biosynthesis glycosyltransferase
MSVRSIATESIRSSVPTVSGGNRSVLNEASFSRAICLERKRTERSQRSFLLMLLDVSGVSVNDNKDAMLGTILSALSVSIRETDVTGWHKNGTVIGIMFSEIAHDARKSIVSTMLTKVNGILYKHLTFEQFNQISISHHIFPEDWDHDVPQRPSHPTLYPDLSKPENGSDFFSMAKRAIDVIGSAFGLLIGAPLFLLIALAIKLSSKGPVFFRQQRVGQFGEPFVFLKFRSMRAGNDCAIHRDYVRALISGQAERKSSSGEGQGLYKLTKDPRVTRIGALLRRTSLDELPQLYNVLKGEMSLVGPRPAIPYEVEAYELWHRRRVLEAKPGLTGLWQVKGRSRVTFDDMVRLDVRYAMTRSLWLDMKIILGTPRAVFWGQGAC